jgi:hypothetical protein
MTVSISKPAIILRRALELTGEMDLERTEFAIALALAAAVVAPNYQEFLTSGTWTKPAGVTWVYVEDHGSGAGGHNATGGTQACGGGGGQFVDKLFLASDVGATETVTIAAGGSGGADGAAANGADGGSSSFGSLLTALGGKGGDSSTGGTSGSGALGGQYDADDSTRWAGVSGFSSGGGGYDTRGGGASTKGGGGGGGGNGQAGGASQTGGGGGAGNTGSGTPAGNGSVPAGGGGGSKNDGGGGSGAAGRIRVYSW